MLRKREREAPYRGYGTCDWNLGTLVFWNLYSCHLDARSPAPNGRQTWRPRLPGGVGRNGVDDAGFRLGIDGPRSARIMASKPQDGRTDRVDVPVCDVDGLGSEPPILLQRCVPPDGRHQTGLGSWFEIGQGLGGDLAGHRASHRAGAEHRRGDLGRRVASVP